MIEEILSQRGTIVVRRLILEPGETTRWHVDPFHRVTVVVRGEALAIEYREGGRGERIDVSAGMADWDAPSDRVHRAVNIGAQTYEEVAVFFLDKPDAVAQPDAA
ncbi:MAG TPA: hypothetical protein VFL57_01675 [Bryobacteraceae bacterium]|nr:hypothetical protein [Bryobacteraceae bacterium]